jgi:septal ring factor EnvC (AmiA/AmiB activator)
MANTTAPTDVVELDRFRSPPRVLASCFLRSRDNWKQKYKALKSELKRWQVRVHDVTQSRQQWREKAEAKERELAALQAQLQELQRQVGSLPSEPQKKGLARDR